MKAFIIHVSTALARENHITNQVKDKISNYVFINEGDKNNLNPQLIGKYFEGILTKDMGRASCAYKHILAYRRLLQENLDYAVVLEDDVFLDNSFADVIESVTAEIKRDKLKNFLISLEDSSLTYVKGSERKKGKLLYKKTNGRMAGAYIIDKVAAKRIIDEIEQNKCHLEIDWFHNYCSEKGFIDIFWSHPTVATQGSLIGNITSIIDPREKEYIRPAFFNLKRMYKKLLWSMR